MIDQKKQGSCQHFPQLDPDTVLSLVEKGIDSPCTNLCRPLSSYINRVFELETEDGRGLVVKFYRPGRWPESALEDEHQFLLELKDHEVPVIAPVKLSNGKTLGCHDKLFFSVFPRCGGRSSDEFSEAQWLEIGRLLGRCHSIGAIHPAPNRIRMLPDQSTADQVRFILESDVITEREKSRFSSICRELIDEINPLFQGVQLNRIHGDCHFSNIIHRPGESFYLIDFDDMAMGPPVQDLWMLLPGTPRQSLLEIELFLEGYETFHHFDRRTFHLVEALRAMRFLHYIAWLTYQFLGDGSAPIIPGFGTAEYWENEINDLEDQLKRIRKDGERPGLVL